MSRTAICSVCGEFLVDSYGLDINKRKYLKCQLNKEGAKIWLKFG
ncbi:hypothetical protein NYR90_00270 [Clostridioides difficile]|nr:hypothetical protein NYR90_00270 [Clostridioides difficile]